MASTSQLFALSECSKRVEAVTNLELHEHGTEIQVLNRLLSFTNMPPLPLRYVDLDVQVVQVGETGARGKAGDDVWLLLAAQLQSLTSMLRVCEIETICLIQSITER